MDRTFPHARNKTARTDSRASFRMYSVQVDLPDVTKINSCADLPNSKTNSRERVTRLANTPSRPVVMFRTLTFIAKSTIERTRFATELWSRKRKHVSIPSASPSRRSYRSWTVRSTVEQMLNTIARPGYGCPVRKYKIGKYVIVLAPVCSCHEPPHSACRIKLTHAELGYSKANNWSLVSLLELQIS